MARFRNGTRNAEAWSMRFIVIGAAAILGIGIGTVSAYAATRHPVVQPSAYDVASTNVDLAQTNLVHGDIASAKSAVETAKANTAACDADAKCKSRIDNFSLHARLDQVERRVQLWSKTKK